ncbi:MAG: GTP-binding protein [Promethearchaeota archaeon]
MLLVGEAAVGKTSLVQKFVKNKFAADYKLTVGVDILTKDVEFKPGEIVTLSIWDIGGQQRFDFIREAFYKGATGALIVFDLTREATYTETRKWLSDIRQSAGNIPFALIGNKEDLLEDVGAVINRDEARSFAENEGSIYIETSAKTGVNVEHAFRELTRRGIGYRGQIGVLDIKDHYIQPDSKWSDLLIDYKDQINSRVREILSSSKEQDFRFLILGNPEVQKFLISKLLSVEGVVWPPESINILYNTSSYKMNLYSKDWKFQVFFLSDLKKINENKDIFLKACEKADGVIVFYDPNTREGFNNAADMCISLRNMFPDLEIILTTGSEDFIAPSNLELERYVELEKLEEKYQINNYDDYESILSEILINVLKRKKKINKEIKLMKSKLKEFQDQLSDQKAEPDKVRMEIKEFLISMEKPEEIMEAKTKVYGKIKSEPYTPAEENVIFISYSHADKDPWLKRLQIYLKPLEKEGIIRRWDDTLIEPGQNWFNEIKRALTSAKVGIFLVSADFLASDFISEEELPDLLYAAEKRGTKIIPVIINPCRFLKTKGLADFQAANDPINPLVNLTKGEQDAVFEMVANQVEKILSKK